MFTSNCDGCIYDVTERNDIDCDKLCEIINICSSCKRCLIGEYAKNVPDCYKAKEE